MDDVLHGDGQEFSDSKKDTMTSLKKKKKIHITNQSHSSNVIVIVMETDGHLQGRPEHRMSKEWPGHR